MTGPNQKRQRESWATLDRVFADSTNVWAIHYSCESFYERPNGRSPRITSIAMRKLDSGQTTSFSIHQVAERQGVPFDEIANRYDELEKQMLDEYFHCISHQRGMKYVHWNMRDINFGFAAIEHRYRVLNGDPFVIDDKDKFDLSRLLIDIYGVGYIDHPRLQKLMEKNEMKGPNFLTGAQEAEAFENRDYVSLHQSILRKVDVLTNCAGQAHDRSLKVNTTWWEMHGGRIRSVLNWLIEHKAITFLASLASIAALLLGLFFGL